LIGQYRDVFLLQVGFAIQPMNKRTQTLAIDVGIAMGNIVEIAGAADIKFLLPLQW
jgi:hypothetical protein